MDFKQLLADHIKEKYGDTLKKRIRKLVEITNIHKELNINIFTIIQDGFYLEGKAFINIKEAWENMSGEGINDIPCDFRFKLTISSGKIVKSEISWRVISLTYNTDSVKNAFVENSITKDKILKLFYRYRVDFSTERFYTDFGIREEDFDDLANDILKLKHEIEECSKFDIE